MFKAESIYKLPKLDAEKADLALLCGLLSHFIVFLQICFVLRGH